MGAFTRTLQHQRAQGSVDGVVGGEFVVTLVVGVARCHDVRRAARVHVAPGVAQRGVGLHARLGGVAIDLLAGVGVQAQVVPLVRNDANAVGRRVEVEPPGLPAQAGRRIGGTHCVGGARGSVQRVQAPALCQGKQHTPRDAVVQPHELVAGRQAVDAAALQDVLRRTGAKAQQFVVGAQAQKLLAWRWGGRCHAGAGAQAQQQAECGRGAQGA